MNAFEIAEKAQASGSMERMSFAEELLGVSCEVVTTGSSKKITDNAFMAIDKARDMALALASKATALRKRIKAGSKDVNVTISTGLCNAADRYDASRFKLMDLCNTMTNGTTTVPVANALNIIIDAMTYIDHALRQFNHQTKSQVRAGFKNEGKGSINGNDNGMSVMTVYKRARKVIAALLKAARAGIRMCNRAVMQANKPERKRIEI